MNRTLIFASRIGPTVGLVTKALEESGGAPLVYFLRDNRFMGADTPEVPVWARDPNSYEFQKWLLSFAHQAGFKKILAIGFESALLCEPLGKHIPVLSLMMPGDVDISSRRKKRLNQFKGISRSSAALIFFNAWEMYKASSIGSEAPHFLWDINADGSSVNWNLSQSDENRIVVFYDHTKRGTVSSIEDLGFNGLASGLGTVDVHLQPVNSFFWYSDLQIGRKLTNTAALRTSGFTDAIFVDNDAESLSAIACASDDNAGSLFATHSVEHELISYGKNSIEVGSVPHILSRFVGTNSPSAKACVSPDYFSGRPLIEVLNLALAGGLPRYFEDFGDATSLNIFFSVAALENRSNGARPQRIRNMYLAMARESQPIHLSFNPSILERRVKLIKYLIDEGVEFKFFYGENSTNPIFEFDGPLIVSRLVDYLSHESTLKSLYFVRDVHWLDETLQESGQIDAKTLRFGEFEFRRFSKSLGGLIAPSVESGKHYSELATRFFELQFIDDELPPALSPRNIAPASLESEPDDSRVTFVYTGGVSKLYSMETYLRALKEIVLVADRQVYADFVVREEESQLLEDWLMELGLNGLEEIRILTESFEYYNSRTTRNIGILLLDSEYGKNAFAFKAVSYLERMIPFIVYKDSPNYRYFKKYGVALPARGPENVEEVMRQAANCYPTELQWDEVFSSETWDNRWEKVKEVATTKKRERR
ncbi:hypothetical protein [Corynebacterium sp. HMSC034H07]|uniref:hypothetical protein n=1 Tax=Corynebacterium sp. HMSC034H07 TaxID=1739512 RepID=UPI0008D10329|nr:hypothetical protein [Corynebacterium sp. HMSC034H07]OFO97018.1 hypothetical protein HMPREF3009_04420 [Corynebacterium sp. HMSC034H07]